MIDTAPSSARGNAYPVCKQCEMEFIPAGEPEQQHSGPPHQFDPARGYCLPCWLLAETYTAKSGETATRNPAFQETRRHNVQRVEENRRLIP